MATPPDPWFYRLIEAIKNSGFGKREISQKAGLGRNFVHQMIADEKMPTVPNMLSICRVIDASPVNILTGADLDRENLEILRLLSSLPQAQRTSFLGLIRNVAEDSAPSSEKKVVS